ncbi:MAG: hypothetical protein ACRD2G_06175 [Terriglobia bacterium]
MVIDDVDGWFGKPGQCLSAAALARVIQRLNEIARSLHVAIVVLVRAQMSVEGRITSRQLSRLSQSASVLWMVVRDREGARERAGEGEMGRGSDRETEGKAEEGSGDEDGALVQGADAEGECKMQNAKCKTQNDASGSKLDSEDQPPKTQDLRTKTSDRNPKPDAHCAYRQSDRRWLLPVKNNLAPDVATFGRDPTVKVKCVGRDDAPVFLVHGLASVRWGA